MTSTIFKIILQLHKITLVTYTKTKHIATEIKKKENM